MAVSHDSETPAHGQQVISVAALIHQEFDDGIKVFMPRRAKTKKFLPDVFELPGGHVDFGEDIVIGLKREIEEELRMHINVGDAFAAFTYANEVKGSHSIEVDYFATFVEPIDQIRLNPADHSEFRWIGLSELGQMTVQREKDDLEVEVVRRGLELLNGGELNVG